MEWELIESRVYSTTNIVIILEKNLKLTGIMMVLTEPPISLQQGTHITLDRPLSS